MNSNWSYGPEKAKSGFDLCDIDLWPDRLHAENVMMIGWWEHSEKGVTNRRTDGRTQIRVFKLFYRY